uniref:C-type lectin domain-containing protein n=1 Tax=Panagrolaimus sp. ES5 TaxID=591445 RepID=A0AC34FQ79_9BILA
MNATFVIIFCCISVAKIFASCPDKSIEFGNQCYIFETNSMNFVDAEVACNKLNGHLASIHDGFTNSILTGQSGKHFHESTEANFWIGLNSFSSSRKWSWTDNSNFDFKEWASSEPKNFTQSCGTVTIQNGLWTSDDCLKAKPFVCEVSANPIYPVYENCSIGWMYFEPTVSCYGRNGYGNNGAFGNIYRNWTEAEKFCQSQNAHLVSIHSYDELKFVSTLITYGPNLFWTGLYSNDAEKTWKWSDGTPVNFLSWGSGRPKRNESSCVDFWAEKFYDEPCNFNQLILCKKPALR